uniref:A2M_N_2 domain-containing protein n=1 Tax=Echinostoma caproni TaxID=27848 RepID=A0A183A0L6_9TREM
LVRTSVVDNGRVLSVDLSANDPCLGSAFVITLKKGEKIVLEKPITSRTERIANDTLVCASCDLIVSLPDNIRLPVESSDPVVVWFGENNKILVRTSVVDNGRVLSVDLSANDPCLGSAFVITLKKGEKIVLEKPITSRTERIANDTLVCASCDLIVSLPDNIRLPVESSDPVVVWFGESKCDVHSSYLIGQRSV